jgi:membrane protein implicated in regulation of membrane protease activity
MVRALTIFQETANEDVVRTLLDLKVILKYTLLNLAELGLIAVALILVGHFVDIPTWLTITVLAVWILKDIAIFPKVWRAYTFDDNRPMRQLIGLEATVMDSLNPVGYVRVNGELWKAEVRDPRYPARKGDRTRVVDAKGMTLVVERSDDRRAGRSVDDAPR